VGELVGPQAAKPAGRCDRTVPAPRAGRIGAEGGEVTRCRNPNSDLVADGDRGEEIIRPGTGFLCYRERRRDDGGPGMAAGGAVAVIQIQHGGSGAVGERRSRALQSPPRKPDR